MSQLKYALNIEEIKKFLPHRYPFLLVDRILEIDPKGDLSNISGSEDKIGTRVVAIKNISVNEPCFTGHFPEFSIYPGVLSLETMAQVACFTAYPYIQAQGPGYDKKFSAILLGVDGARLRKPITPGDQMRIETQLTKCRSSLWAFEVVIKVDDQKVAEADLMANFTMI
jgi:3-hydroxyacyl-[acyl-carrier-protein] dehydratase